MDAGKTRLSHSHEKQYMYVLQSLTLWREIVHDLFRLWWLSEQDLLDSNVPYDLRNTGQGDQRVQPCNRISKAMHGILYAGKLNTETKESEHCEWSVHHVYGSTCRFLIFLFLLPPSNFVSLSLSRISSILKTPQQVFFLTF